MRLPGRTERRLAFIFVMVATIPLVTAIVFARYLTNATLYLFYNTEVLNQVERSLSVYNELARSMKANLRAKADAIAAQEPLRAAAILRDQASINQELAVVFKMYPDIVSITVLAPHRHMEEDKIEQKAEGGYNENTKEENINTIEGSENTIEDNVEPEQEVEWISLGHLDRGWPIDNAVERKLEVTRPLDSREGAPSIRVIFAAPREVLDTQQKSSEFLQEYRLMGREQRALEGAYLKGYASLLGLTVPLTILLGVFLARKDTRRIAALTLATQKAGRGDLSIRVPVEGNDELTQLAAAFNQMFGELRESRARIEFLGQMGTWQEMARRLAHEIKNPLTPIQLAVQECHRRYDGASKPFQKMLDTTLEIVEEEVGTLRRLVTEFSNFARLPQAELLEQDLAEFLREQQGKIELSSGEDTTKKDSEITLEWSLPEEPILVAFDSILLHRVLINLTANAEQAIRNHQAQRGVLRIQLTRETSFVCLDVEDDGPGVPQDLRGRIFDPYFTTKSDGNGLGLAIVKKIIVEHGGSIEVSDGSLGGARLRIRLPLTGTPASLVALSHSGSQSPPSASPT